LADFRLRATAARSQSARRPARPAAGVPPVTAIRAGRETSGGDALNARDRQQQ